MKSAQIALRATVSTMLIMQVVSLAQAQTNRDPDAGRQSFSTGTEEENQHLKLVTDLMARGDALFYQGKWDDALSVYQQVEKIEPEAHFCYEGIGDVALQKGDLSAAIANYQRALHFDDSTINRFRLAVALGRQHDYDDAIGEYQTGLRYFHSHYPEMFDDLFRRDIAPNESGMHLMEAATLAYRANEFNATEKNKQATTLLQQALNLEPHLAEVHLVFGSVLRRVHKTEEARAEFEKAAAMGHGYIYEKAQGTLSTFPPQPTK